MWLVLTNESGAAAAARSGGWRLPLDLRFRAKGRLANDILGDACADGLAFDFVCGDEVYGSCTDLGEFLEEVRLCRPRMHRG
jgi:hypothetical protein